MPGNKKPKKRYNPARAAAAQERRLTDQLRASIMAKPLAAGSANQLSLFCHVGLEAVRTGAGTVEDLGNLELLATQTAVLCAMGYGPEHLPIAEAARLAVSSMADRYRKHSKVLFAGKEYAEVSAMLELNDAQLQQEGMTNATVIESTEAAVRLLREQAERYFASLNARPGA